MFRRRIFFSVFQSDMCIYKVNTELREVFFLFCLEATKIYQQQHIKLKVNLKIVVQKMSFAIQNNKKKVK